MNNDLTVLSQKIIYSQKGPQQQRVHRSLQEQHSQARGGNSPFPLGPAFLQQADIRNNTKVDVLASNPSRKKAARLLS